MAAAAPIASIGATESRELVPAEVFDTSTTMATATENSYLVNKIALLQIGEFERRYRERDR